MTRSIRVLIADDHPMVRIGLAALLEPEPGIEVVAVTADGAEALAAAAACAPDVVLTDLRMPGMDGVALTAALRDEVPSARVVVVTTYETDSDILRAVEAGAAGYLLKDAPPEHLIAAVRAAAAGETVLAPAVAARLVAHLRGPAVEAPTVRELEVLRAVADGLTNAEVGRRLCIGESTVKTHLLRVFVKLGVDDRTAAVTLAMRRGLL